jgi:predicted Zn finger-like uncharacterized protein
MIITCEHCRRKFRLDEHLLKPSGSRVRCSRCLTLFRAWPPEATPVPAPIPAGEPVGSKPGGVPMSVPVTCTEMDAADQPLNFHIGRVTELAQGRLIVDVFCSEPPERVALSFINTANQPTEIRARVVSTSPAGGGKTRIGLSLVGTTADTTGFVKQLVQANAMRAHQST